ncbi:MAG TPA: hypothetical protein VJ646_10255 [Candidatus Binatia bacterium]|nr:hypothetical protein [Candidatus Binatia bacterium]
MKTIRGYGSHRGTSFSDVSNRPQKVIRADKKFLAVGLVLLLAGWITLMVSMRGIEFRLPETSGAPQTALKFTIVNAQELLVQRRNDSLAGPGISSREILVIE